jgi:RNA polymerase sigma factor (sigma-70 family)
MDPMPRADVETLLAETNWVRRVARGLTRDPHSAAEIEQETWLTALAHGTYATSPRAWLAEVARNLARRAARRAERVKRREVCAARPEAQPSAAELVERADLARTLARHVLALEEPYRSTLLLRYFEELPPRAIAAREGVPVSTIKTRLARGLDHLRARLDASSSGDREHWLPAVVALAEPVGLLPLASPPASSSSSAGLPGSASSKASPRRSLAHGGPLDEDKPEARRWRVAGAARPLDREVDVHGERTEAQSRACVTRCAAR